jgi:transcription elongation factor GreA
LIKFERKPGQGLGGRSRGYNVESLAAIRPLSNLAEIKMTDAIKRKLQEEINALEHELIHELPKEIKKAAALGDLSENAEYHMAKQRQEFVKARVRQLGKRLADLSMVNMNNIPHDKVGLGSTVKVYDNAKGEEVEYKLVTSEESDVAAGKISTTSPIGRALLNKKVGDEAVVVSPNGKRELEILSLSTIHDELGDDPKEAQA